MDADLARQLAAAPWWEWRLYMPVVEAGESGMHGARGVIVPSGVRPGQLCVRWAGPPLAPNEYMETSITHGTVLDLDSDGGAGVLVGMLRGAPGVGYVEIHLYRDVATVEVWSDAGARIGAYAYAGPTLGHAAGAALLAVRGA